MTLGELKVELQKSEIRQVGILRRSPTENGKGCVTVYFSSDPHIVVPFRPKNIYPLVVETGSDTDHVNIEKVRALKRAFGL